MQKEKKKTTPQHFCVAEDYMLLEGGVLYGFTGTALILNYLVSWSERFIIPKVLRKTAAYKWVHLLELALNKISILIILRKIFDTGGKNYKILVNIF